MYLTNGLGGMREGVYYTKIEYKGAPPLRGAVVRGGRQRAAARGGASGVV